MELQILALISIISIVILQIIKKTLIEKIKAPRVNAISKTAINTITFTILLYLAYETTRQIEFFLQYQEMITKIFYVLIILTVSIVIGRVIALLITKTIKSKRKIEKTPNLINKLIMSIVILIGFVIILSYLGVEITPLLAALGIGGIAIGLALQPTLSNLFAGMHILSDKPIRIGDYVELEGGQEGYVEDIGWRSTKIKNLPNNYIIIPNGKLVESIIKNTNLPQKEMAVLVQVGVDYSSDLKKVEKITNEVAKKIQQNIEGAVSDFEPFIRYHTFADSNINFTVILRAKTFVDKYLITHEFIKALKDRYDKEGIEISWPIRKISRMK